MEVLDFILNIDIYLGKIIASYGNLAYLIIFLIIFAETGLVFTPFLPGDSLLFAAGMFSALDSLNIVVVFFSLWCASFLGDNTNYWIGRYFGQKIVDNKRISINQSNIDKTNEFFRKHGRKTVVLARFMPIVRTFAPFVAGIGQMRYGDFAVFSFFGGLLWIGLFAFAGYFFGNMPLIKDNFSGVILVIIAVSVFPAVVKAIKSKLEKQALGEQR